MPKAGTKAEPGGVLGAHAAATGHLTNFQLISYVSRVRLGLHLGHMERPGSTAGRAIPFEGRTILHRATGLSQKMVEARFPPQSPPITDIM